MPLRLLIRYRLGVVLMRLTRRRLPTYACELEGLTRADVVYAAPQAHTSVCWPGFHGAPVVMPGHFAPGAAGALLRCGGWFG